MSGPVMVVTNSMNRKSSQNQKLRKKCYSRNKFETKEYKISKSLVDVLEIAIQPQVYWCTMTILKFLQIFEINDFDLPRGWKTFEFVLNFE